MTVLIVPERYPTTFTEDFANGIGNWTAGNPVVGGPRSVTNGVFSSHTWGYDSNHLTTKGGPGMLHLLAYADFPYWPDADFTNARVSLRARGVNFNPNGSQFIAWITATHPHVANKNVNWGFVTEPRTALLQTGNWEDVEWQLTPDPSKWVFGKGENGGIYDTFLSLQESLQNIFNVHFLMLGPDNVGHPSGTFELDSCSILYNRKAADPLGACWGERAPAVSLSSNRLIATHAPFTATGGVRGNTAIVGKKVWAGRITAGDPTNLCFAFGVVNSNFNPAVDGGTFFAQTANGWGFLTDQAVKRHNGTSTSYGLQFAVDDIYMVAVDEPAGKMWIGKNWAWFGGGDPESGANPTFSNLSGDLYPFESNGTGNGSFVCEADFAGPFDLAGFSGF